MLPSDRQWEATVRIPPTRLSNSAFMRWDSLSDTVKKANNRIWGSISSSIVIFHCGHRPTLVSTSHDQSSILSFAVLPDAGFPHNKFPGVSLSKRLLIGKEDIHAYKVLDSSLSKMSVLREVKREVLLLDAFLCMSQVLQCVFLNCVLWLSGS